MLKIYIGNRGVCRPGIIPLQAIVHLAGEHV